ncbi:cytochrome P450 [Butyriboletus roseoflavus]|nr:cytochrome P450 [Butyriboletus roseoflavus]
MISPLLEPPAGIFGCIVLATALIVVVKWSQSSKLDRIPTVGSSGWLGSWWAVLKYLINATDILQEGYEKHKSAPFKVTEPYRWVVVLSNREHVEELRRAPDGALSFKEAVHDQFSMEYTTGAKVHSNSYHIPIVRAQLTRNIEALYPEIKDEMSTAFDDVLDLRGNEWKSVPALSSVQKVVCRTSNRVFVGLSLCRDPDWMDLNIQYAFDIIKGGAIIGLFPKLLKPIAARLFTSVSQSIQRGRKLLEPIIEERRKYINEYGKEWVDKPNDFISWLMEEHPELMIKPLTRTILALNVAAIHVGPDGVSLYTFDAEIFRLRGQTTSNTFTQALFYLVANPQYIQPLREEVEGIVEKEGWSKVSLAKMRKVDSFLKECQRFEGISSTGLMRKALKDYTFSDGTFVPKGTTLVAAMWSIQHDEALYENAHAFKPFRFADLHGEDGEGVKYQFTSTSTDYLVFGHGRHACPGRFFAATELKSMLAHIVVTYDVKLADNATPPRTLHFATALMPDPRAKLMFRRRVD